MPIRVGRNDRGRAHAVQAAEKERADRREKVTAVEPKYTADTDSATSKPTAGVRRDARTRASVDEANRRLFFDRNTVGDTDLNKPPATREVHRDPDDVNGTGFEDAVMAKAQLLWHQSAERRRIASLDPSAQQDYRAVAATTQSDPVSRRALQQMLLDGRLDGQRGKDVLGQLSGLTRDRLANGLERDPLVQDLVQEIADPAAIDQQGFGTCGATTTSIYLAKTDPAEYARLVRGLASPEGKVTMKNGQRLARENDTVDEPGSYHGTERSQSSRLLVPALMEYGNPTSDYDPVDDSQQKKYGWLTKLDYRGLTTSDIDRIMEGITGREFDSHDSDDGSGQVERIAAATSRGQAVPTSLDWGEGGHEVLVTNVTADRVFYTNPWGTEESMSREEFEARFTGASFAEGT